ncbi:hypothetical protein FE257_007190 [Aspergillus nanangensis]|uniref:Actin binding protein n=1 Tax=Aspergillus nanangensis TaxID=2582783 RepID=A0AAD4GUA0_ASPNN|nr:hypothetical protein FE257_007190 [Aspergillus nanangensis]
MATLNLSANGPSISKSYQTVVNSSPAAGSPTYGQWAVFSVSTPLVNAFQRDAGNKESVLKVQSSGEGELSDLIDEFSEGKIQFAFVKVICPNTGLPKNVLIAWCGEGVPERTKGYFTSHLSAVSKVLHGYHVQLAARTDGDLTAEGIIHKVGDASGSKYTPGSDQQASPAVKPPVSSKPVFTPTRALGTTSMPVSLPLRTPSNTGPEDDGWGPDAPPVTRTGLEKVQPAYQPTKVNIQNLRSEKQPSMAASSGHFDEERTDIVKGGYQPVGRVDIAAIRRQAREAGGTREDRPEPVKGSYEPVGKVDIAAIRAKAQDPNISPSGLENSAPTSTETPAATRPSDSVTVPNASGRLTSLPKPKISNKFGPTQTFTGTKPPLPSDPMTKPSSAAVGSASRTFADEGGKTPAQIWAEKKAKERGQSSNTDSPPSALRSPVQDQHSGQGEWKSSYTGKSWAPVQITHTGKSVSSNVSQNAADSVVDTSAPESQTPQQSVGSIRDQFMREPPKGPDHTPEERPGSFTGVGRTIPLPGLPAGPTEPEQIEPEAYQAAPPPPQQPRSPTPPSPPTRESSPIRVAMPVARAVTDVHDEQHSPPPVIPTESLQQAVPNERDLDDDVHDIARATAEATAGNNAQNGGIQALVQYDYEKAEDNELELREGEYVTDIEMVDKDWWLGSNAHGERGLFPSNYVEISDLTQENSLPDTHETPDPVPLSGPAEPSTLNSAKEPTATALYDYEAAEDNELSFPEGAEIENIEFPDDDWWYGEYYGKKGLFPANYVQLKK